MNWTELVITTKQSQKELLQDVATTFSDGFALEDYSDMEQQVKEITHAQIIDQSLAERPKDIVKMHLYYSPEENIAEIIEKMHASLHAAAVEYTLETASVKQEDWESAWKQYYHPFDIGKRLTIVPSWENHQTSRTVLTLDPGMAFGTGTHETTHLCLEYLDHFVNGGERVLDIGTGSGILAIASILLGAKSATGIDIDPHCVRVASENAALNKLADKISFKQGNLADETGGTFEIITANIIAEAIVQLAPAIPPLLSAGGVFIASGIISDYEKDVVAALEKAGLKIIEIKSMKEWLAILCGL